MRRYRKARASGRLAGDRVTITCPDRDASTDASADASVTGPRGPAYFFGSAGVFSRMTNCTRRFLALPASVSLSAMGFSCP